MLKNSLKPNTTQTGQQKLVHSKQRSASQQRFGRTNSLDRSDEQMTNDKRHSADGVIPAKTEWKDYSVVAVYSREAFEYFATGFTKIVNGDPRKLFTNSSQQGMDDDTINKTAKRHRTEYVPESATLQEQFGLLLSDKINPHIIAVIEGSEGQKNVSLKASLSPQVKENVELVYTKVLFNEGLNINGNKDAKQNMTFYVRNDMIKAYSLTDEKVFHENGKHINAVGLNYTVNDVKYRSLVVHIPNEFVGSEVKDGKTHNAFVNYANELKKGGIIVTNYFGDTNYEKQMFPNSAPSVGGHTSDGETINPQSSGAKNETNFMQSIPTVSLEQPNDLVDPEQANYSVKQPSTLTQLILTPNATNREAIDHPSIMCYTAHNGEISGRDSNFNKGYYLNLQQKTGQKVNSLIE